MNTFLLIACTFLFPFTAVDKPVQLDAVVSALSKGDAKAVGVFFDQTVELVLPGVDDILPKADAEEKLAAFFLANPAQSFTRVHGGTSTGEDGSYVIGTLKTETRAYRVYIYARGTGTPTVQELRIEAS
ncbi:MAG: DUF4783 domain-containing protein [Saprospiraceae bacterium]